jgi:pyrroloquinoline quinone (PQQ) biosynthesis protein C
MNNNYSPVLDRALQGRRLLEHPFYRRWESGRLTVDEITHYAEQYRHFETMLPEFLGTLADRMPDGVARTGVLANLADEMGNPSHLELFECFAEHYEAESVAPSPAMNELIEAYRDVLDESDATAIAGLLAYELQGADIAATKSTGLHEHYGASSAALAFWEAHSVAEGDHAAWTLEGLLSFDDRELDVERGVTRVAQAWWEFLDEREALIPISN